MARVTWLVTSAVALVVLVATFDSSATPGDQELTIKMIMTKAHKGGNSILSKLGQELKQDAPAWADVRKKTKELVKLGTSLSKATPPQGEKASWEKLTKSYVSTAKELDTAVEKMDRAAAAAAQKKLTKSCSTCHSSHKG